MYVQQTGIGAKLRELRTARGWTQADLSHYTRLSASDISKIETGRLVPSQRQIERINAVIVITSEGTDR